MNRRKASSYDIAVGVFFLSIILTIIATKGFVIYSLIVPPTKTIIVPIFTAKSIVYASFENQVNGIVNKEYRYPVLSVDMDYFSSLAADKTVFIGEVHPNIDEAAYFISNSTIYAIDLYSFSNYYKPPIKKSGFMTITKLVKVTNNSTELYAVYYEWKLG